MVARIFQALLIFPLVALAVRAEEKPQRDITITLERTSCLGTCPVYKLAVKGDGSVIYDGKEYVRVKGIQRSKIEPAEVERLAQAFLDIHYFELQDGYQTIKNPDGSESIVTDLPTTYTSLVLNGRSKRVEDYVGAPKELEELEREIDSIAGTKKWVAIDAPTVHEDAHHGWDINGFEARRLFMEAVRRGDIEVALAFIQEGVDVNAQIGQLRPLQIARGGALVKELISAGANVNVTSKEYFGPPLVFAAELGDVESVAALLDAGARVNATSPEKETALMKAAESGSPEAVKALLLAGAEVNLRDSSGETALDYAGRWLERQQGLKKNPDPFQDLTQDYEQKYKDIRDLLIAAGGESKH